MSGIVVLGLGISCGAGGKGHFYLESNENFFMDQMWSGREREIRNSPAF